MSASTTCHRASRFIADGYIPRRTGYPDVHVHVRIRGDGVRRSH